MKAKPAVPGFDGPRKTALESIRLFCIGCMDGSFALVTDCPSTACMFFPYRSGAIEPGASRRLLKIIKAHCDGCAPGGDVSGCTAGKCYLDLSPCPVWPYRRGVSPYYSAEAREQRRTRAISLFGNATQEANSIPRINGTGAEGATSSRRMVRGVVTYSDSRSGTHTREAKLKSSPKTHDRDTPGARMVSIFQGDTGTPQVGISLMIWNYLERC